MGAHLPLPDGHVTGHRVEKVVDVLLDVLDRGLVVAIAVVRDRAASPAQQRY